MRLALQEGQTPRPLQEKETRTHCICRARATTDVGGENPIRVARGTPVGGENPIRVARGTMGDWRTERRWVKGLSPAGARAAGYLAKPFQTCAHVGGDLST